MSHYQYTLNPETPEQKEILIALLIEAGFNGFEEEGEQLIAFTVEDIPDMDFRKMIDPVTVNYSRSLIKETNWNQVWESSFEPVFVSTEKQGAFATIRAHFHTDLNAAKYNIIITPKMSFGTGHHATTYGMIKQMSEIDLSQKEVIDFGTGTGVLAILAEMMGAVHVLAIDNDEWSIRNAEENIKTNGCTKIELVQADQFVTGKKADIILANINLNVILSNLPMMLQACNKNGILLLSGMLVDDIPVISVALQNNDIHDFEISKNNNWIVIVAKVKH